MSTQVLLPTVGGRDAGRIDLAHGVSSEDVSAGEGVDAVTDLEWLCERGNDAEAKGEVAEVPHVRV
jgi:hypothetical protein